MTSSLRDHVKTCRHPACIATRKLQASGANLVLGKGRHCEFAVLAAAGTAGIDGRGHRRGTTSIRKTPWSFVGGEDHRGNRERPLCNPSGHAADGNVTGMADAVHPIPLGSARVRRTVSANGESFDLYHLRW